MGHGSTGSRWTVGCRWGLVAAQGVACAKLEVEVLKGHVHVSLHLPEEVLGRGRVATAPTCTRSTRPHSHAPCALLGSPRTRIPLPQGLLNPCANDLRARAPHGRTVDVIRAWFWRHDALLRPPVGAPAPRWQQAPKTWSPGPMWPTTTTAVIGGWEAKTTRERVVY